MDDQGSFGRAVRIRPARVRSPDEHANGRDADGGVREHRAQAARDPSVVGNYLPECGYALKTAGVAFLNVSRA